MVSSLDAFGGLSKIVDKATRVSSIGKGILALLSVVMSKTQAATCLQTVCDALLEHAIFGMEATELVLNELYQKYFFKQNREIFSPWKVLKAMGLSAVGGLNYNGIETLRLFVDNIDMLVNHVFSAPIHEQHKQIRLKLISDYQDTMRILWKRSKYTESDINEFQLKINDFFVAYIEYSSAGKVGVTNYTHMLGSGHIAYYMKTHGNLYKFSQQG